MLATDSVSLLTTLEQGAGYFVATMPAEELAVIRSLIREQYLARLLILAPQEVKHFYQHSMADYHLLVEKRSAAQIDHRTAWPKSARILGPNAFETVFNLPFFKQLREKLNIQAVATEEGCGWQEMYWRIVRPGESDIGSLHADRWFWDLGHGTMPKGMRRLKIWIAIEVEKHKSGLRVIPKSQLKDDWRYHGEVDHTGITKPKFDEDETQLNVVDVPTDAGDFIVFHDDLIHGGMPNSSNKTRVSLEATLLIPTDL